PLPPRAAARAGPTLTGPFSARRPASGQTGQPGREQSTGGDSDACASFLSVKASEGREREAKSLLRRTTGQKRLTLTEKTGGRRGAAGPALHAGGAVGPLTRDRPGRFPCGMSVKFV